MLVSIDSLAHLAVSILALGSRCPAGVHMSHAQRKAGHRTVVSLWMLVLAAQVLGWMVDRTHVKGRDAVFCSFMEVVFRKVLNFVIVSFLTLPFIPLVVAAQVQFDWLGMVVQSCTQGGRCEAFLDQ